MLSLTLILPLLLASAGECHLVTNEKIELIPCDFSAATTDALRYAAEDADSARPRLPEPRQRVDPVIERAIRRGKYRRPSRRNPSE